MKNPKFSVSLAVFILLGFASSMAFAEKQARQYFGKGNPFTVEELPEGKLKAKLQTLDPQARGKAMKWLHGLSFQEFDAAEHLRVDKDGGIYIVCPDGHGNCDGKHHKHHEEEAPAEEISITEPIEGDPSKTAEPPTVEAAAVPISSPPAYNSKPGAPYHIYLDFNGAYVTGKAWSSTDGTTTWTTWDCDSWGTDSDKTTFSDSEQAEMRRVWERISEDYSPYNVNVTTDVTYDSVTYTGDKNKVGWLLFTATTDKTGARCPHYGSGGVAYVGVFSRSDFFSKYQPAWVTPTGSANMAEAAAHEMGHNLGLSHDGTSTASYYGGHAATTSAPSWGPIMGTGYSRNVSQWSKASEYYDGNQTQDDLSIMAGHIPYRTDDHGDTFGTATAWLSGSVNQKGVVERTNNSDVFTFNTGAGSISFSANTYRCDSGTWGANLDAILELYNDAQVLVASNNPAAEVNATLTYTAPAGRYYLVLKPSAAGSPLISPPSGYTNYGSLGQYTITGNFIPEDGILISSPGGGESWIVGATYNITWGSAMGGNVKIELLKNGSLNSTIISTTPNDGSYTWTIPSGQTLASDYKVRITSVEDTTKTDQSLSNFSITTDPLGAALDTVGLAWTTSGNLPWLAQTTTTKDGIDAARSGAIADAQSSSMETTIVGPGTMTFWWKVSSESSYDFLRFYLNGVEQTGSLAKISGSVDWVQKTVTIPTGSNVVKWSYTKDANTIAGSDTAWVDMVVFTGDAAPEIAVEQPVGTGLTDGASTVDFGSVNTGSSTQLTFTIKNVGTADLNGLALSKSGTHSADYTLGSLSTTILAAGTSTTFTVTFAPGAAGTRTAALQIASDDANENPFDINLTGNGVGPGSLSVTGTGGLSSSGAYGGPFSPASIQYTLSNPGSTSINWTAGKTASWVDLSSVSGTLAAGTSTTVTVSINSNANALNAGNYNDTVTFTNTTNSSGNTTRGVALTVNPIAATVTLSNLLQTYDGSPKPVTVTTTPAGLSHSVTYNGSATVPSNAGSYAVVATVTEPNYTGSASGTLVIAYTVSYQGNGNTSGTAPANQTKFHDVALTLATNSGNLNKTDYSFVGWNTAADGSGTDYLAGGTYSGNASLVLYAKWVPGINGTWIQTTAGPFDWSTTSNWSGGNVAAGADRTASFTPDITANQTVNLDTARTIGNITFTDSTTSSNGLTISGASTLTLSRSDGAPVIDVTQSGRSLTISSVIAGANGVRKNGVGDLILSGNNNFTGGLDIYAGRIVYSSTTGANVWGDASNVIKFIGNATLHNNDGAYTLARGIAVNSGVTASLSGAYGESANITGAVTGSGDVNLAAGSNGWAVTMSNTANTLSGTVWVASSTGGNSTLSVSSLADGADSTKRLKLGNGGVTASLTFAGTSAPIVWNNRALELSGSTGAVSLINNAATSNTVTIHPNMIVAASSKTFTLDGSNTGTNTIAGSIGNGSSGSLGIAKSGNGVWALGGTNTYSGATTLNASGTTGILVFQGSQSLSSNTSISINQASSSVQSLRFLDNGTGTINFARPISFGGSNTTQSLNIFIGNNNTANKGSGSGTTTGSTIQVGSITFTSTAADTNTTTINSTGSNDYRLRTGIITLNNLVTRTAGATTVTALNPTTANMTVDAITMASGNTGSANDGIPVLRLAGTTTDNHVAGAISNASDYLTGQALSLQKQGAGTWILFGANTYTGTTTVSEGKLFINGDQSAATGDLSVASTATLGGTGTLGGNVTLASGGKLEFDLSTAASSHNPMDISAGKGFTFSGSSTLTITSPGGASPGTYTLISGGNNLIGVAPATLVLPASWVATVSISGNSLLLNVTSTGGATAGNLAVASASGLSSSGYVGGPFSPDTIIYTLSNSGDTSINWTASKNANWVTLSAASGTLAAGASTEVTVSINSNANALVVGSYNDTITFTNTTNGNGNTTRGVTLTVNALPTYIVSYDGNGNTGGSAPSDQTKTQDVDLILSGSGSLVRTGYTFTGWNTAADGSETGYAAGATYTANTSVTLYAQWTANTHTVTFNSNGGDVPSPSTKLVTFGSAYGTLATVTRTGYTFDGWFTAASGGTLVNEQSTVITDSDHTLYAHWSIKTYTVSYAANGATSGTAPSNQTKTHDVNLTLAANSGGLSRTGYTFSGWNTAADGSGITYNVEATYTTNADLGLFAKWTANIYTVTFDANGGSAAVPTSKSVTFGSIYDTLATTSRTGYNFNGWFTAAVGGNPVNSDTTVTTSANHTLYAQWTQVFSEMDVTRNSAPITVGGYDSVSGTTPGAEIKLNYEIVNSGSDNLTLASAIISGSSNCTVVIDTQPSASVAPLGSTSLILTVIPTAAGAWSLAVSIQNNDPNENPYQWMVHGVAASSTTASFVAVADTYINDQSTSTNYGTATTIALSNRTSNPNKSVLKGLLRFDLSSIPTNAIVDSATLDFVQDNTNSGLVDIVEATGTWGETTATWGSSSGLFGSTSFGSVNTGTTAGAAVTPIILNDTGKSELQSWVTSPSVNYGFGITTTYNARSASLALCSREHTTTTSRPKLTVTYSVDPQVAEMDVARAGSPVADGGTDAVSGTVAGGGTQLTYTIANLGNVDLTLTTPVSVTGASNCAVQVNNEPANTVVASTGTNLVVTVTPTTSAAWSANISIANNDPDENPYNWTISGTATGQNLLDHFMISSIASPQTVGTAITGITLTAQDAGNATVTSFTGTVTFGGTAGITGTSASFVDGVLSGVSITPSVTGTDLTFTVNDGASHTGSATFNVRTVFADWSGGTLATTDSNNDGIADGLAWLLGAADPTANATTLLPTLATDADYFIYTYRRSDEANNDPGTTIAVLYGSTLESWTAAVHDGTDIIITPTNDFYGAGVDKVEVKIRKTLSSSGKLFSRLSVQTN